MKTISVMKEHDTWLIHYKPMRWEKFSPHQSHTHEYVSLQTLTTLDLYKNNIGAAGARHLAHALQTNAVREVLSPWITYPLICFIIDTHHTESWWEQNRCWRGTALSSCITKQCGERSSLLINYIHTNMFHYRHSPHWIFVTTISVLKEHNTWLMHYKTMRWEKFPARQSHTHWYVSM
jgi:hypothetical protein